MRRYTIAAASLLAASGFLTQVPGSAQSAPGWTEMLMNDQHTSYVADPLISTGNATTFGVQWMAPIYSGDYGSPAVAYNSTLGVPVVYVGTERGDVFAFNASTGAMIWSTNLGVNNKMEDSPMVAPDGTVWIGTDTNPYLYKLNGATGAVECSVKAPVAILGSPITDAPNGVQTVFWETTDNSATEGPIFSTNEATCTQNWEFLNYREPTSAGAWGTPAYGTSATGENLLFVGTASSDSTEYAIDATSGQLVWDYPVANPAPYDYDIGDGATVSPPGNNGFADGVLYLGTKYGTEYALDLTNGSKIWQFQMSSRTSRASGALDGNTLVFAYPNGVYSLNATTGAQNWLYSTNTEVISSPAIIGPQGSEVAAFGVTDGTFRVLNLASGSLMYQYQTGNIISSSPAEYNGVIYIASSDGFLYAFGPGGGNGTPDTTTISTPSNLSTIANPNGTITVTGSSSGGLPVNAVTVAIQNGGGSGQWYNATTGTYGSAPTSNAASVANPGSNSTTWSFSFPAPPQGGDFTVWAKTVTSVGLTDRGAQTSFVVQPSTITPNITALAYSAPPGGVFTVSGAGFKPKEAVTIALDGTTIISPKAGKSGALTNVKVKVPTTTTFGPTTLTATGQTSGFSTSTSVYITNNWSQFNHDPEDTAAEPHDPTIEAIVSISSTNILSESWFYQSTAPVNSSPVVVDGTSYFGNDAGIISAVVVNTGAPQWTYTMPDGLPIQTSPAVDSSHNVIFSSTDGSLNELNSSGSLVWSLSLGGTLSSPSLEDGQIFVSSSTGTLYDVSESTGTVTWSATLAGSSQSSPAFDALANLVVVGDNSGAITAFNATTGTQVWQTTTGAAVTASPMIYSSSVFVGSGDSNFYALNETSGAIRWKYAAKAPIAIGASLYDTNQISFADTSGYIYLVTAGGSHLYSYLPLKKGNAIVGDSSVQGNIMLTLANGSILMIRQVDANPSVAWQYQSAGTLSTAAAIVDGTVYVGSAAGGLYAFTTGGVSPLVRHAMISITDANGVWQCSTP